MLPDPTSRGHPRSNHSKTSWELSRDFTAIYFEVNDPFFFRDVFGGGGPEETVVSIAQLSANRLQFRSL